jgi:acetoin utilization deacetylase AcuC-like enzyme
VAGSRRPLFAWSSDHFPVRLPLGHPFPMAKYAALRKRLLEDGVLAPDEIHHSEVAPLDWILRVHDPDYVERAVAGKLDESEVRRLGFPWSSAMVDRARAAVYGTVMAAAAALEQGVAGNLAGGTHHAFRDHGEGYCMFNDLAVAIAVLRSEGAAKRPFIVDLDVHQGNGTAALFADDQSVFTFSAHGVGNYPARKEQSTIDIELPDGCEDADYLDTIERFLPSALAEHRPDLVFYQAGVDALAEDRLGRLSLTREGLARRDDLVFRAIEETGAPVVVTLGGGYAQPLEASVEAHVNVWRAARRARDRRQERAAS